MTRYKCATCGVVLEDDNDVVYGLYDDEFIEFMFCSRFCRGQWNIDHRKV